ncbi:MAG: tyrosine--tRNA ligase [delta proteobacterium ML8_F1]|nr:MAG: tyrosine--tRNA ligase [delta proteobacterium ML8_F1]
MMSKNVLDVLTERGFLEQLTHPEEIRELLDKEKVTFYIGFDPTADSLHIGHYIQIMVMSIMQQHGHRPIALLGGGTTMVGDPSDRTGMRQMMTFETINHNAMQFKKVFEKFLDFSEGKAIMVNNADWLMELNYIEFLREVGIHFSVNRMLSAEAYKNRMERGLTFLEFNYMIMQAYDFLVLSEKYDCKMQFGGNDQWSNILAGTELIRKKNQKDAFGMTFTLLTNSEGKKMGKTEKGALWLDAAKTSPYDFYQYWRNVDDADVKTCLSLLTFIPMEEVNALSALEGSDINKAKERLAYEVTEMVHGTTAAKEAQSAARALFAGGADLSNVPTVQIEAQRVAKGVNLVEFMVEKEIIQTKSEGRRLIEQRGIYLGDQTLETHEALLKTGDFKDGFVMLRKGKKKYYRIELV